MAPPAPEPDPLADLRDQLRATQEAAARLAGGGEVPPQGWASRADGAGSEQGDDAGLTEELQQLVAVVASLRELVPPELQQQVTDLIRQILLLVRALLDRVIEHLEPTRGTEPDVEDIPIS
jgi:small-conductance mechanosensitive channel